MTEPRDSPLVTVRLSDLRLLWEASVRDEQEVRASLDAELQTLRTLVHGHTQVIRGMCSDELDRREIDRALVRLDDAVNPPEDAREERWSLCRRPGCGHKPGDHQSDGRCQVCPCDDYRGRIAMEDERS